MVKTTKEAARTTVRVRIIKEVARTTASQTIRTVLSAAHVRRMTKMSVAATEKTEMKEAEIPVLAADARARTTKEAARTIREKDLTTITTRSALKLLHLQ